MEKTIDQFLNQSPLARRIRLQARVVVQRSRLSSAELAAVAKQGEYRITGDEMYELECGGVVIATGRIVEQEGEFYFQPETDNKEEQV